jgi:hypothetical protein
MAPNDMSYKNSDTIYKGKMHKNQYTINVQLVEP